MSVIRCSNVDQNIGRFSGRDTNGQRVVIKNSSLENEPQVLKKVSAYPSIRQLIDTTHNPKTLILLFLQANKLEVCSKKRVPVLSLRLDTSKQVGNLVFKGSINFEIIADHKTVDIKLDNILVNDDTKFLVVTNVNLADYSVVLHVDPNADPLEEGHVIDATVFRSPEAMFNLRWGPSTEIGSFGTMVSSSIKK